MKDERQRELATAQAAEDNGSPPATNPHTDNKSEHNTISTNVNNAVGGEHRDERPFEPDGDRGGVTEKADKVGMVTEQQECTAVGSGERGSRALVSAETADAKEGGESGEEAKVFDAALLWSPESRWSGFVSQW